MPARRVANLLARPLYGSVATHTHYGAIVTETDQQLAGLIMVSTCPLTYVAAAIAIAALWLRRLETQTDAAVSAS